MLYSTPGSATVKGMTTRTTLRNGMSVRSDRNAKKTPIATAITDDPKAKMSVFARISGMLALRH
jgi:hypothetical protein